MSRRMKKNRRVLSFALAFVMLVSLLPLSAVFSALAAGDEDADISVVMTADKETCSLDETAKVTINAEIAETIQSAEVTIHFDAEEVTAIRAAESESYETYWNGANFEINKDGSANLTINLTKGSAKYETSFPVAAPEGSNSYTFEVKADNAIPKFGDISYTYVWAENNDPANGGNNSDSDQVTDSEGDTSTEGDSSPSTPIPPEGGTATSWKNPLLAYWA